MSSILTRLDHTPADMRSNLIYKIHFKDSEQCYIGMIKQHLKNRVDQHKHDCMEKNKIKKKQYDSGSTSFQSKP